MIRLKRGDFIQKMIRFIHEVLNYGQDIHISRHILISNKTCFKFNGNFVCYYLGLKSNIYLKLIIVVVQVGRCNTRTYM